MSAVVYANGCVPLLLYVLLYGVDAYLPGLPRQTPVIHARFAGVGLLMLLIECLL